MDKKETEILKCNGKIKKGGIHDEEGGKKQSD
jgi:hypothetical protein